MVVLGTAGEYPVAPSKGQSCETAQHVPRLFGSLLLVVAAGISGIGMSSVGAVPERGAPGPVHGPAARPLDQIVPAPGQVRAGGAAYTLTARSRIQVEGRSYEDAREARRIGSYLAGLLRPSTGYALPVTDRRGEGGIRLRLVGSGDRDRERGQERDRALGEEGYRLESGRGGVTITAQEPAGLFHGVQTLRQLLPASVEKRTPSAAPGRSRAAPSPTPRATPTGARCSMSHDTS